MSDYSPHTPEAQHSNCSSPFAAVSGNGWPESDSQDSLASMLVQEDAQPNLASHQQTAAHLISEQGRRRVPGNHHEDGLNGLISPPKKQLRVKLPGSSRRQVSWGASPTNKKPSAEVHAHSSCLVYDHPPPPPPPLPLPFPTLPYTEAGSQHFVEPAAPAIHLLRYMHLQSVSATPNHTIPPPPLCGATPFAQE